MAEVIRTIGTASGLRWRDGELPGFLPVVRAVVVGVVLAVAVAACGGGDAAESATRGECAGRAEFWRTIQQDYLDRLGDAAAGELDPPSARVSEAGEWLGTAMVEFSREADSVGCAADVRSGSPLICAGVEQLEPRGGAGELIVGRHTDSCSK